MLIKGKPIDREEIMIKLNIILLCLFITKLSLAGESSDQQQDRQLNLLNASAASLAMTVPTEILRAKVKDELASLELELERNNMLIAFQNSRGKTNKEIREILANHKKQGLKVRFIESNAEAQMVKDFYGISDSKIDNHSKTMANERRILRETREAKRKIKAYGKGTVLFLATSGLFIFASFQTPTDSDAIVDSDPSLNHKAILDQSSSNIVISNHPEVLSK